MSFMKAIKSDKFQKNGRSRDYSKDIEDDLNYTLLDECIKDSTTQVPLPRLNRSNPLPDRIFALLANSSDSSELNFGETVVCVIYDVYVDDCANFVPEVDRCPICLDHYNIPKITKCGHIFCYSCLIGCFKDKKYGIKCPICYEFLKKNEFKSIIWRYIKRLEIGSFHKFFLHRLCKTSKKIEKITIDTHLKNRIVSDSFQNIFDRTNHIGNGILYLDAVSNSEHFIPYNNTYVYSKNVINSLFDIEYDLLKEQELLKTHNFYESGEDFYETSHKHTVFASSEDLSLFKDTINDSNSKRKHFLDYFNIIQAKSQSKNSFFIDNQSKNTSFSNTISLCVSSSNDSVNFEVNKTANLESMYINTSFKTRESCNSSLDSVIKTENVDYLYFYKSDSYFNLYLSDQNFKQIVAMSSKSFNDDNKVFTNEHFKLPIVIEGELKTFINYDVDSATKINSYWNCCCNFSKFICFTVVNLMSPNYGCPSFKSVDLLYTIPKSLKQSSEKISNSQPAAAAPELLDNNELYDSGDFYDDVANSLAQFTTDDYPEIISHSYDMYGNETENFPQLK